MMYRPFPYDLYHYDLFQVFQDYVRPCPSLQPSFQTVEHFGSLESYGFPFHHSLRSLSRVYDLTILQPSNMPYDVPAPTLRASRSNPPSYHIDSTTHHLRTR